MCLKKSSLVALTYLQTSLSSVVDHTDESEASAFRACMASLLSAPSSSSNHSSSSSTSSSDDEDEDMSDERNGDGEEEGGEMTQEVYEARHGLFEELCDFFEEGERQPREDLRDMAMGRREGAGRRG
ncbi:hypothetical protein P7C70_g8124, partial [Phenoliferia sp. Uapishka_3]